MGLTRIRAEQISDIDYKQAVRAITVSNVTLTGGAPNSVDGVNLLKGDRILVAGQDTGSQNGLYNVTTLGTGSNGTWTRTSDANQDGEIEAGMLVMVTEGDTYKDTLWKLTTNNPITVGSTALTFELNTKFGFGNVYANGTGVVATVQNDVLTLAAGENISIIGNAASKTITFSIAATAAYGNADVVAYGEAGWAGNIVPAANITYDLGSSSQRWKDLWLSNSTIYLGSAQISANSTALVLTNPGGGSTVLSGATPDIQASTVSATGNVTGGNLVTIGQITATGNITGGNINGGANVNAITHTGSTVSVSGNVDAGNLRTAGVVSATGNITGGNLSGTNIVGTLTTAAQTNITSVGTLTSLNSGTISSSGNVTGANILTGGIVSATGNITGGNVIAIGTVKGATIDSVNADLAERYQSDQLYAAGTVVIFGGEQEITQSEIYADPRIAGVISTAPAYRMNADADGQYVALQGRVPCRIVGKIAKGDLVTSSDQPGVATRLDPDDWRPGSVIGKALEDFDGDQGVIEVVVGRL